MRGYYCACSAQLCETINVSQHRHVYIDVGYTNKPETVSGAALYKVFQDALAVILASSGIEGTDGDGATTGYAAREVKSAQAFEEGGSGRDYSLFHLSQGENNNVFGLVSQVASKSFRRSFTGVSAIFCSAFFQVIFLYLVIQGLAINLEFPGAPAYIPVIFFEYGKNMELFHLAESPGSLLQHAGFAADRKIIRFNSFTLSYYHCTFDHVFELSHVAGPVIFLEKFHRLRGHGFLILVKLDGKLFYEVPGKQRDIVFSFS